MEEEWGIVMELPMFISLHRERECVSGKCVGTCGGGVGGFLVL